MSGPFTEGGYITRATPTPPPMPPPPTAASYPLDNDDVLAGAHHRFLSALLDPVSRLRTCEVFEADGGLAGKRCLEVGAGVGAHYARWLADQVGPHGHVLAVDVKPRDIPAHPRLSVRAGDVRVEDGWLGGGWDFIHARLTLGHLPARREILTRLVAALAPGGRILIEDWEATRTHMVMAAPTLAAAEQVTVVQETVGRLFARAGTDRSWARRIHAALLDDGLAEVHTVMHAQSWAGGSPGARLLAHTIDELRPALLAAGHRESQLNHVQTLLADPGLVLAGHLLYSTSGQRPEQETLR